MCYHFSRKHRGAIWINTALLLHMNHQSRGGRLDQSERTLPQHGGLQVRHELLSQPAHADGAAEAWPACKRMAVEEGIAGGAPGAPAIYVAMGHLYFDSTDAFQTAFAPHPQAILADIPNYTNVQPTIQISEVKM